MEGTFLISVPPPRDNKTGVIVKGLFRSLLLMVSLFTLNTIESLNMKYNVEPRPEGTAILSIRSSPLIDPNRKPQIWRFFPRTKTSAAMSTGAALGRESGKTCVLVVQVLPQDLICIREKMRGIDAHRWRYFRVAPDFQLIQLNLPNRCISQEECSGLLQIEEIDEHDQIDFNDEALRAYLAQEHPSWLRTILDRQIRHWKMHKPDNFFRLAPSEQAGENIALCVEISPQAALARFQDCLDETQLSLCIAQSPKAAAMFALDRVSDYERRKLLENHTAEALLYSSAILSDREIAFCAKHDPFSAFRVRKKLAPRHHAIVLAHSYLIANPYTLVGSWTKLQEEVRDSLMGFTEQWRASDPYGFPSIFSGLETYLEMKINQIPIGSLLKDANPDDRQDIADYVASLV